MRALLAVLLLTACGRDPAGWCNDVSLCDAGVDPPDGPAPDADPRCAPGLMCLETHQLGGETDVPAGRLAVAWISPTGGPLEIALDRPWAVAPLTEIALADIAIPSASHQWSLSCATGGLVGYATVVLSTDPGGDGTVTSDEILAGYASRDTYGIHQATIRWSDVGCSSSSLPPDGVASGIHLYAIPGNPVALDGRVTVLQVCRPHTAFCDMINDPFHLAPE